MLQPPKIISAAWCCISKQALGCECGKLFLSVSAIRERLLCWSSALFSQPEKDHYGSELLQRTNPWRGADPACLTLRGSRPGPSPVPAVSQQDVPRTRVQQRKWGSWFRSLAGLVHLHAGHAAQSITTHRKGALLVSRHPVSPIWLFRHKSTRRVCEWPGKTFSL